MNPERIARVALGSLFEPADPRLAALLRQHTAVDVLDLLRSDAAAQLRESLATRLPALDPRGLLTRAAADGIRFIIPGDTEWPGSLDALGEAAAVNGDQGVPVGLWVRGPYRLADLGTAVAIVGSRSATTYGTDTASGIAAQLSLEGVTVVSGGAVGIDAAAHMGALAVRKPTIAVLAGGVDRPYPKLNTALLARIAETGAVVSEAPLDSAPMKHRFLTRNRLIASLSLGTLVVEAAARSGSLNTANWADQLSRAVMALPGPVTSAQSEGTHALLRNGASLVTCAEHVLELVGPSGEATVAEPRGVPRASDRLTKQDRRILDATPVVRPAAAASIARVAGVGLLEAAHTLAQLERAGAVMCRPDGWVQVRTANDTLDLGELTLPSGPA
ncbi:MAG: DNA-processing protein DprA [Nocardioides sp.]